MQLEERIEKIIWATVYELGFLIVRVQLSGINNQRLQIMVEPIANDNMTVEHCAIISRTISALLDVDDPIEGSYTLEVSSPGLDRPLVKLRDFERFIGYEARIETMTAIDGRKRFRGRLGSIEDKTIIISVDGGDWAIPYASIRRAKLVNMEHNIFGQKFNNHATEKASELI